MRQTINAVMALSFGKIGSRFSSPKEDRIPWSQNDEENFIKYDLPVHCKIRSMSYAKCLRGYVEGIQLREVWWPKHDIIRLIGLASQCLRSPPKIWSEKTIGRESTTWFVQYPGSEPKKHYWR